jgi:propanol-preferring alcohol dehydrogenase
MKAFQLIGGSAAVDETTALNDVAQPDPGPGQVLVRVGGAGACHSDISLMEFSAGGAREVPMTLGHENAGWIEAFGPGTLPTAGLEVGAPVAVYGAWGCGQCQNCRKGMENYCLNISASGPGLSVDGGMAEYLLVPATRYLVPLGDMSPVEAAPLTDAGLTPYHAIKAGLHLLVPGSYAVVIGAGGLGHLAVQFLKALSPATVICVDQRESALEVVAGLGADHTVVTGPTAAEEIRGIMGGRGAEMVLDICGYDDTLALAAAVSSPLGRLTIVGVGGGTLPVNFFAFPYECSVQSTYWGSITELGELLALARTGDFRVHAASYTLDQAAEVYRSMVGGTLQGRAVIVPNAS